MGEAKRRGTFEQRVDQAQARDQKAAEEWAKKVAPMMFKETEKPQKVKRHKPLGLGALLALGRPDKR